MADIETGSSSHRSSKLKDEKESSHRHHSSSSRKRSRSPDHHRSDKKDKSHKYKDEDKEARRKRRKERKENGGKDAEEEEDEWEEKGPAITSVSTIPTSDSLYLESHASQPTTAPIPQSSLATETSLKRDDWMMGSSIVPEMSTSKPAASAPAPAGGDLFSDLGTISSSRQAREDLAKKVVTEQPRFHRREINTQLLEQEGIVTPSASSHVASPSINSPVPGGPGSQWRMTKLARVYAQAAESGMSIEEAVMDRYGNMQEFHDAVEERRVLDERDVRRAGRQSNGTSGRSTPVPSEKGGDGRKYMFMTDAAISASGGGSRPGSRAGFKRPGEEGWGTPGGEGSASRVDALKRSASSTSLRSTPGPATPIPSVLPPPPSSSSSFPHKVGSLLDSKPILSTAELNKLQAAVIRARLMDASNAASLEAEFEAESARARDGPITHAGATDTSANSSGSKTTVQMVPTLDGRGQLYDVGTAGKSEEPLLPGNRRKNPKLETHDSKTGEVFAREGDDGSISLGELVRQERFGAGAKSQKDMDFELAVEIAGDGRFQADNDYLDENADRLAKKKIKSDSQKRLYAINDYARTKKALDSCQFCPSDSGGSPRTSVISMGTKVYLANTQTEELVDGHCLIVPLEHCLCMLEGDEDMWEEVKNFMKSLIRMFAEKDRGCLFYETVLGFKQQRHSYIECVPVPWDMWEDAPQYFKESILASETEWSQHKKLIDFSARPGGFRRSLVKNLPYFMVSWDYKGEKGYGHVIEGTSDSSAKAGDGEDMGAVDEGDKGGGEFPRYFAAEIIGSMLELAPNKWRKPKRVDNRQSADRVAKFNKSWKKHDWTLQISA